MTATQHIKASLGGDCGQQNEDEYCRQIATISGVKAPLKKVKQNVMLMSGVKGQTAWMPQKGNKSSNKHW